MLGSLKQIAEKFGQTKNYLFIINLLLVLFLVLLSNLKVIPLELEDFIFFALLFLVFSLYRPGWAFIFFVGTIALENVNLAPENFGIEIRPYQLLGALILFSMAIRFATKKLSFKLLKFNWQDYILLGFIFVSFLSSVFSEERILSLKLAVILGIFYIFSLIVKNYVRDSLDIKKILPFFLGSAVFISAYGIWQNIRYLHKLKSYEVMFGRPNATLTEPDWLGMFLVMSIAVALSLVYYFHEKSVSEKKKNVGLFLSYASLLIFYVTLILTVARSSWLGAFCVTFIYLFIILTNLRFKDWQWKKFFRATFSIAIVGFSSILAVHFFHLTNFQLFNRATSTQTGLQKITVSCKKEVSLPAKINSLDELEKYNCRHINLEEIETEKKAGFMIGQIERNDPNIDIRSEIYRKSWKSIKENPLFGIGWGNIGNVLGKDPRGITLNASNIFLEISLGSGLIGLSLFLVFIISTLIGSVRNFFFAKDALGKAVGIFLLLSWFAAIVPNIFNAGLLLGFFWIWIAISQIKNSH